MRADHPLGGGRATLLALGSFDHLDIKDQNIGDASLNYHRVDLRWDRPVAGGTFFARSAFGTDAATSQLYDSPLRVRGYSVAPRLAYSHPIGPAHFEVGADAEAQRFDADVTFDSGMTLPGTMPDPPPMLLADLARDRNALSVRGYAAATIPFKRLSLEPGLRYAQYFEQGVTRGAWEPRLTVRIAIVPGAQRRRDGGALLADAQPAGRRRRLRGVRSQGLRPAAIDAGRAGHGRAPARRL